MQPKVYDILMDVKRGLLNNEIIKVVTGDYGMNKFNLKLLQDRLAPYNLQNTIVRIMVVTPSGSRQQQDLAVENAIGGSANITLKQSLFSESGEYLAEFQIFDETTQVLRLTTPRFKYFAVESLQDDETILASDEYSILQDMIKDVGDINNNINGKIGIHNEDEESHPSFVSQLKEIETNKANRIGGDSSTLPTNVLQQGWPNNTNSDAMNFINQRIFSFIAGNNGVHLFGDRATNARRFGIQVGHIQGAYASAIGILELNPFGGEVKSNGKQVATTDRAIAESGSNANGSYIRFGDGTAICYNNMTATNSINIAYGNIYTTGSDIWTFPSLFLSAPNVFYNERGGVGGTWAGLGNTATYSGGSSFQVYRALAVNNLRPSVSLFAIGRWK